MSTDISDSESIDEDQEVSYIDLENEYQSYPYLDPTLAPNRRTKWSQKIIEATRNSVGDPYDKRRIKSQF